MCGECVDRVIQALHQHATAAPLRIHLLQHTAIHTYTTTHIGIYIIGRPCQRAKIYQKWNCMRGLLYSTACEIAKCRHSTDIM